MPKQPPNFGLICIRLAIVPIVCAFAPSVWAGDEGVFGQLTPRHLNIPPVQFSEWVCPSPKVDVGKEKLPTTSAVATSKAVPLADEDCQLSKDKQTIDWKKARYWFVAVAATWNPVSFQMAQLLNVDYARLQKQNVGVVVGFSENNPGAMQKWLKQIHPVFTVGTLSNDFVKEAANPKIPTVWLLDNQGSILEILEMPTLDKIDHTLDNALQLTDF